MSHLSTSCTKCGKEILINGGWKVEHTNTLTKRTRTKERGVMTFNMHGYLVNVDPGIYLPEGQQTYTAHECKGMNK